MERLLRCPRQDSNLRTRLRRAVLYPLSYEGGSESLGHRRGPRWWHYDATVAAGIVLVVDDDAVILKLLQVNFELEGYEVICAAGGAEALLRARDCSPDVVVLDVMMPGIDGLEVARELRADPATAALPILLLSAKAQVSDIDAGRELADDYMTKPFDAGELLDRVGALLARHREGDAGPQRRATGA